MSIYLYLKQIVYICGNPQKMIWPSVFPPGRKCVPNNGARWQKRAKFIIMLGLIISSRVETSCRVETMSQKNNRAGMFIWHSRVSGA